MSSALITRSAYTEDKTQKQRGGKGHLMGERLVGIFGSFSVKQKELKKLKRSETQASLNRESWKKDRIFGLDKGAIRFWWRHSKWGGGWHDLRNGWKSSKILDGVERSQLSLETLQEEMKWSQAMAMLWMSDFALGTNKKGQDYSSVMMEVVRGLWH